MLNTKTAYLMDRKGNILSGVNQYGYNLHPYVIHDLQDFIEQCTNTDNPMEIIDDLVTQEEVESDWQWFIKNTKDNDLKNLLVELTQKMQSNDEFDVDDIITANEWANNEFLRFRLGGEYSEDNFRPNKNGLYIRVSSTDFNWYPLIWQMIYENQRYITNITIERDAQSNPEGFSDVMRVKGEDIEMYPTQDFLNMSGHPIVENLLNEKYLDDAKEFYDYGTGDANVETLDVVDTKTTGVSFYNDFLTPSGKQYMIDNKNLVGGIVMMTPSKYYEECAKRIFGNTTVDRLKEERAYFPKDIEHLKDVIFKMGKKLCLPYLNYASSDQEGLHRMMALGELFGWNEKFPVLVVTVADQKKQQEQEKKQREWEIDSLVDEALQYKYHSIEELQEELEFLIENKYQTNDYRIAFTEDQFLVEVGKDYVIRDLSEVEFTDEEQIDDDILLDEFSEDELDALSAMDAEEMLAFINGKK